MAEILLTSGPTRQYLDPVRYLTNASSGLMGISLCQAALDAGHNVTVVSGPIELAYPTAARVLPVVSTEEMLATAREQFAHCDGLIGVAAPCDYRPVCVSHHKIKKSGEPLLLHLIETPDIVAELGAAKKDRWVVGFALETEDHRFRAINKLQRKSCDLIVLNEPSAMNAQDNHVEVFNKAGETVLATHGSKRLVAAEIFRIVQQTLIDKTE